MSVTGVLLAAGFGERLRPLTEILPKPALPLLDLPLGAWGLENLARMADRVVVNVSHLGDRAIGALAEFGDFEVLDEGLHPWGTGGTLAALREGVDGLAVTASADLLTDLAIGDVLAAHLQNELSATIAVRRVASGADMTVEEGRAVEFIHRRRDPHRAGVQYLNVGVFDAGALELLPPTRPAGLAEHLLVPLIQRDQLAVHISDAYALDVGTPARYLAASLDLLGGRGPLPPRPHPGEFVEVPGGRAYLGPGAGADEDALGPGAIVMAGAILHAGCVLRNAIVWPDEEVPPGTRIEDGVWAAGAFVPAT